MPSYSPAANVRPRSGARRNTSKKPRVTCTPVTGTLPSRPRSVADWALLLPLMCERFCYDEARLAFADTSAVKEEGTERVTLYRDDKHLYINGVRFPMRRLQRGEEQQLWLGNLSVTDRDYETELDAAATSIDRLVRDLSDNLFVSEEDKKSVAQYVSIVRKEIAWARVDMRKLRYGDE